MPKKYDTNQLDPEYPEKIAAEAQQTATLPNPNQETRQFAQPAVTEEQTRKFEDQQFQSLFEKPGYQPPSIYQTSRLGALDNLPINRKVDKVGLPENVLVALPYLPWGIGLIAGIIELLIVPNSENKVRFHAAQGLALNLSIIALTFVLGMVGNFSDWADVGNGIFQVAMTICSVFWAIRAYQGKPILLESIEEQTNWLEENIRLSKISKISK